VYTRESNRLPLWMGAFFAALLVFGGCFLWRGLIAFVESGGNITAPVTSAADQSTALVQTQTSAVTPIQATLSVLFGTPTAARPCIDFYVTVVRARVRECPNETCETITMPYQNAIVCVYGPAKDNPDWYEVNVNPKDPIPQAGYMHKSVIYPRNPTPYPTPTPRVTRTPTTPPLVLATVTPVPEPTP